MASIVDVSAIISEFDLRCWPASTLALPDLDGNDFKSERKVQVAQHRDKVIQKEKEEDIATNIIHYVLISLSLFGRLG